MRTLIAYLPVVACMAMMALICVPMMRNMHRGPGETHDSDAQREIDELRDEIARLKAERTLDKESETVDG